MTIVLIAELERLVHVKEFMRVCKRRKPRVNAGKNNVTRWSRVMDGRRMYVVASSSRPT